jgi:hypothetical protein
MADRYLKVALTVIAIELAWLGVKDVGTPVAAQANTAPTPVVIRAIEMRGIRSDALPVYAIEPVTVTATRPLPIEAPRPIPIMGSVPLKIEVDRPIPVENVGYTPGRRPGE